MTIAEASGGARPEIRSPLRRLLDVWGVALPDLDVPHETLRFRTRDGVELCADLLHGPAAPGAGPAAVVLHGFAGHRRKPAYARLAQRLAREMAVLAVDLRGHGASGGRSSFGAAEVHDVRAAAALLRRRGHDWVALIGASMGATAALRAAGQTPGIADAIAAISAPAEFVGVEGRPPVALLSRMLDSTPRRLVLQTALRVRIASAWGAPAPPVALVGAIAPTPLLLIHGNDDHWFEPEHLDRLAEAAGENTSVWCEPPGFGHAEDGFTDAFLDRLAVALSEVRRTGRWPDQR